MTVRRIVAAAVVAVMIACPALADRGQEGVKSSIVVHAAPRLICEAINDPNNFVAMRELSGHGNRCVFEETFFHLPVIGDARCQYVQTVTPFQRVDYHMTRSDKLRAFEGYWTITPAGDRAVVELYTLVDTGIRLPGAREITNLQTLRGVRDRLRRVKKVAEANQRKEAARSTTGGGTAG